MLTVAAQMFIAVWKQNAAEDLSHGTRSGFVIILLRSTAHSCELHPEAKEMRLAVVDHAP
ncbi:hypothetical protein T05_15382 [Trichinella murrelli]|uniref:Uncharacterized protein n=1 Tax=Trichinella murrelli TaxID=144512 RepID=A0A0V0SSD6_9BILA|nr:hypothetical protein T05_15382 [Trichinella murrelli]